MRVTEKDFLTGLAFLVGVLLLLITITVIVWRVTDSDYRRECVRAGHTYQNGNCIK